MKILNIALSVLLFISLFCFILTFAISVPIYSRSFYYNQIEKLDLEEQSGYTKEQIKEGYDQLMDYLVGNKPFAMGDFKYSQEGKEHFADVKRLFTVNLVVMIVSFVVSVVIIVLDRVHIIQIQASHGKYPWFYTGVLGLLIVFFVGILAIIDFGSLFSLMHQFLFAYKDNWTLNPFTDPIIEVLPEEFFFKCGILITVLITVGFIMCIIVNVVEEILKKKKIKAKKTLEKQQKNNCI